MLTILALQPCWPLQNARGSPIQLLKFIRNRNQTFQSPLYLHPRHIHCRLSLFAVVAPSRHGRLLSRGILPNTAKKILPQRRAALDIDTGRRAPISGPKACGLGGADFFAYGAEGRRGWPNVHLLVAHACWV